MTETIESTTAPESSAPRKRGGGLSSMLIADLKSMAAGMGIAGAGSMKKAQLVEAIKSAQSGAAPARTPAEKAGGEQSKRGGRRRGGRGRGDKDAKESPKEGSAKKGDGGGGSTAPPATS